MAEDNSDFYAQLAKALAAAGGGLAGRALANQSGNPLTRDVPPQLSQLLDNTVARQGYQNPLFQATTKGTYDMLPSFAKEGSALSGSLPSVIPPSANTGSGSGGGSAIGGATGGAALAALAGLLGGGGNGGGGYIGPIIKKLMDLFHKKSVGKPQDFTGIPSYDPFNSNNFWDGTTPDLSGRHDSDPFSNVTTDQFLGLWPEGPDPFAPFDPSLLGGGTSGSDPWGAP